STDLFAEVRAKLDRGDYPGAADAGRAAIRDHALPGFTLQIAIACQPDSVRKAAKQSRGSSAFFIVPFSLSGRACYRLCWGNYSTLDEARTGKSSVPTEFLAEGGSPVVVSFAKLVPGER